MDSGMPKEARMRWGSDPSCEGAIITGKDMPGHARRHSALSCAKMAEPIDLQFRLWSRVGKRKHNFNRITQVAPMCRHGRAHWRHLANTIESSVCCSNAALCQITLTTWRKSPILTYSTCIWRLRWGWPRLSFAEIFDIITLESLCGVVCGILRCFSRTPTWNRQTDRQTDTRLRHIPH